MYSQHGKGKMRQYTKNNCPETVHRLDLINRMAIYDELERVLTYPSLDYHSSIEADEMLEEFSVMLLRNNSEIDQMSIYSFDIDLTLALPWDVACGCTNLIPIKKVISLQQGGAIVGTCSDRSPSDQRETMTELGFNPDFCIPKEMLGTLKNLLPAANLIHIGDSETRDQEIAVKNGWIHIWPWNAFPKEQNE